MAITVERTTEFQYPGDLFLEVWHDTTGETTKEAMEEEIMIEAGFTSDEVAVYCHGEEIEGVDANEIYERVLEQL